MGYYSSRDGVVDRAIEAYYSLLLSSASPLEETFVGGSYLKELREDVVYAQPPVTPLSSRLNGATNMFSSLPSILSVDALSTELEWKSLPSLP